MYHRETERELNDMKNIRKYKLTHRGEFEIEAFRNQ